MKLPLLPVALAAAILLGAAAGAGLRLMAPKKAPVHDEAEVDGHSSEKAAKEQHAGADAAGKKAENATKANKADKHDKHEKKKDESKKDAHGKSEAANFLKFSRQFVVPIMEDGKPKAMMILDVMVELDENVGEGVYAEEPRLRDAVLRALLKQSGAGGFGDLFEQPEVLEATRAAILEETRTVIGDGAKSILIMDVGYQAY